MVQDLDIPKASPRGVAAGMFNGVAAGALGDLAAVLDGRLGTTIATDRARVRCHAEDGDERTPPATPSAPRS